MIVWDVSLLVYVNLFLFRWKEIFELEIELEIGKNLFCRSEDSKIVEIVEDFLFWDIRKLGNWETFFEIFCLCAPIFFEKSIFHIIYWNSLWEENLLFLQTNNQSSFQKRFIWNVTLHQQLHESFFSFFLFLSSILSSH